MEMAPELMGEDPDEEMSKEAVDPIEEAKSEVN